MQTFRKAGSLVLNDLGQTNWSPVPFHSLIALGHLLFAAGLGQTLLYKKNRTALLNSRNLWPHFQYKPPWEKHGQVPATILS